MFSINTSSEPCPFAAPSTVIFVSAAPVTSLSVDLTNSDVIPRVSMPSTVKVPFVSADTVKVWVSVSPEIGSELYVSGADNS